MTADVTIIPAEAPAVPPTEITREIAREISNEIRMAADAVLAKYGLEATGTASHYGCRYDWKITAVAVRPGKNGVNLGSIEAQHYLALVRASRTLREDALGDLVRLSGRDVIFMGEIPRSRKFRWLFKDILTGEMLKYPQRSDIDAFLKEKIS
jgi:hypothetical protein